VLALAKHGPHSWELDALKPELLSRIVRSAFSAIVDNRLMEEVIAREDRDKGRLRSLASRGTP
jgi:hypothetical protein